jgi:hypothetical protein
MIRHGNTTSRKQGRRARSGCYVKVDIALCRLNLELELRGTRIVFREERFLLGRILVVKTWRFPCGYGWRPTHNRPSAFPVAPALHADTFPR